MPCIVRTVVAIGSSMSTASIAIGLIFFRLPMYASTSASGALPAVVRKIPFCEFLGLRGAAN